ncbi:hypothetical protein pb186bvf_007150 [Paramecium bursaria]
MIINGNSSSRSRSFSQSLDDSLIMQILPINQKMNVMNQQTTLVRKPVEHKSMPDIQGIEQVNSLLSTKQREFMSKSPQTTNITPQMGSDRMNQKHEELMNDLILIKEEPSVKEQSMQMDALKKQIYDIQYEQSIQKTEPNNIQMSIDIKQNKALTPVQWTKLNTNKTTSSSQLTNQQILMIKDKSNFIHTDVKDFKQLQESLFILYQIVYSIFLTVTLTTIILELSTNKVDIIQEKWIQYGLFFLHILFIMLQFIQKSMGLIKLTISLISLIPFVTYAVGINKIYIDILFLLRLIVIIECFQLINQSYQQYRNVIQKLKLMLEIHFISLLTLFIILLIAQRDDLKSTSVLLNYGLFNLLSFNNFNDEYQFYLIYVIKLIYVFYLLNFISINFIFTDMQQKERDQILQQLLQLNLSKKLKQQCVEQVQMSLDKKINQSDYFQHLQPKQQAKLKYEIFSQHLQRLPIFEQSLQSKTTKQICQRMQEYVIPPNTTILLPQMLNQSLYFILEGKVQIYQGHDEGKKFNLKVLEENEVFNQVAFFQNQSANIGAYSLSYCRLIFLDYDVFHSILMKTHIDRQRFQMYSDQINLYKRVQLCGLKCYACEQNHDIDHCKRVHYTPNTSHVVGQINQRSQHRDFNFRKKKEKKKEQRTLEIRLNIEESAKRFQGSLNLSSDISEDERNVPSLQKQLTTPYTAPHPEVEDGKIIKFHKRINSVGSIEDKSGPSLQQPEFPNISPVTYQHQPQSAFSHSSYGFLLKDSSVNNNKRSSDKNSSNLFSVPHASSSGTSKNKKNSDLLSQQKFSELIANKEPEKMENSVRLQKQQLQDSMLVHQKRISNAIKNPDKSSYEELQSENPSYNQLSQFQKYKTATQNAQPRHSQERSERKSVSMISGPQNYDQILQDQNQDNRQSKYAVASSKFTGETAKQFQKSPFDVSNVEFHCSFENNQQFSDYFPQNNVDQLIENYQQFQKSKSSVNRDK